MKSYRLLISTYFYLIGCLHLILGTIYLIYKINYTAVSIYISGTSFLTIASLIDIIACIISKPKIINTTLIEMFKSNDLKIKTNDMKNWKKNIL